MFEHALKEIRKETRKCVSCDEDVNRDNYASLANGSLSRICNTCKGSKKGEWSKVPNLKTLTKKALETREKMYGKGRITEDPNANKTPEEIESIREKWLQDNGRMAKNGMMIVPTTCIDDYLVDSRGEGFSIYE